MYAIKRMPVETKIVNVSALEPLNLSDFVSKWSTTSQPTVHCVALPPVVCSVMQMKRASSDDALAKPALGAATSRMRKTVTTGAISDLPEARPRTLTGRPITNHRESCDPVPHTPS